MKTCRTSSPGAARSSSRPGGLRHYARRGAGGGRPVIATAGRALDTVVEGVTGVFFDEQTVESLSDALRRFAEMSFSPAACRANAERFDRAVFDRELATFVEARYDERARRTIGERT